MSSGAGDGITQPFVCGHCSKTALPTENVEKAYSSMHEGNQYFYPECSSSAKNRLWGSTFGHKVVASVMKAML